MFDVCYIDFSKTFFIAYLKSKMRKKERHCRGDVSFCRFTSLSDAAPRLGQTEARKQGLPPGVPTEWQWPFATAFPGAIAGSWRGSLAKP